MARVSFVLLYVLLLSGGLALSTVLPELHPGDGRMMAAALALFVGLSAIPFVPGAEIGFGLLVAMGAKVAVHVYLGMVAALSMAFTVGRLVPQDWVANALLRIGARRAAGLVRQSAYQSMQERERFLIERAPVRVVPFLLRHRYVAMALLLNLPGNVVLGGGGGLAFAAGASRLFSPLAFLVTILIAVAPFPLAFLIAGRMG